MPYKAYTLSFEFVCNQIQEFLLKAYQLFSSIDSMKMNKVCQYDQPIIYSAKAVVWFSSSAPTQYQRWILKKLLCLAASLKSAMVATNSAPNFDLEDFF